MLSRLMAVRDGLSERQRRALSGATWSAAGYGFSQLLRLAFTLALARRLLSPDDFGVVALVNVLLTGLEMFSELGLGTNVVRHDKGEDPAFLGTAFRLQAVRGAAIWLVATLAAYPFAQFYGHDELAALVIVAALSALVRGVASPAVWVMTRRVELGGLTLVTIASDALGFAAAVAWAWRWPSPWALVAGTVVSSVAYTAGTFLLGRKTAWGPWDGDAARSLMGFGAWIFLATATAFLGGQGERLIFGKFVSAADLGCLAIATMFATAPSRGLGQLVGQVFFPMMAESLREERARAIGQYRKARIACTILGAALSAFLILVGPPIVGVLLPREYEAVAWMVQLVGVRAGIDVLASPVSAALLASGRARVSACANGARVILLIAGLSAAFAWFGLREAIAVTVLAAAVSYLIAAVGLCRDLRGLWKVEMASLSLFVAVAAIAVAIGWS